MRVEDKNLNEIRFRSDVYKMLSEPGKSALYAIPDTKFDNFSEREFEEKVAPILGHSVHFCQDNESMSSYGVMRGLHFQRPPYTQSKLVRCVKGRVLDVAVDICKGSPTLWQACSRRVNRRQSCPVLHPKGLCPWFRSPFRNSRLPVQV